MISVELVLLLTLLSLMSAAETLNGGEIFFDPPPSTQVPQFSINRILVIQGRLELDLAPNQLGQKPCLSLTASVFLPTKQRLENSTRYCPDFSSSSGHSISAPFLFPIVLPEGERALIPSSAVVQIEATVLDEETDGGKSPPPQLLLSGPAHRGSSSPKCTAAAPLTNGLLVDLGPLHCTLTFSEKRPRFFEAADAWPEPAQNQSQAAELLRAAFSALKPRLNALLAHPYIERGFALLETSLDIEIDQGIRTALVLASLAHALAFSSFYLTLKLTGLVFSRKTCPVTVQQPTVLIGEAPLVHKPALPPAAPAAKAQGPPVTGPPIQCKETPDSPDSQKTAPGNAEGPLSVIRRQITSAFKGSRPQTSVVERAHRESASGSESDGEPVMWMRDANGRLIKSLAIAN